ncbi:MAG: pyridoxamine 5'-phosphate oxidase family protein [Bacteroidota bacterium]
MNLFDFAKSELIRSNADRRHPFRFFSLATLGVYPEVRTVVKRKFAMDWSVLFFTDSRTPKVMQLKNDPKVTALFYHPKKQLQIRLKGLAEIISVGEEFEKYYQQIQQSKSIKDYTTQAPPGTEISNEFEVIYGDDIHFLPIKIIPQKIDILQLNRTQHLRSSYEINDGEWMASKLVP